MFYLLDERFILIYDVNIGFFSQLVNRIYSGFLFQLTGAVLKELIVIVTCLHEIRRLWKG